MWLTFKISLLCLFGKWKDLSLTFPNILIHFHRYDIRFPIGLAVWRHSSRSPLNCMSTCSRCVMRTARGPNDSGLYVFSRFFFFNETTDWPPYLAITFFVIGLVAAAATTH